MRKTFTWTRPDQPYHTTTDNNLTIEVTYLGPRYIMLQVDRDDHQCHVAFMDDDPSAEGLDVSLRPGGENSDIPADEFHYVVLDADEHPAIASFLTDDYEHEDPSDYTETYTDADGEDHTYNHVYDGTSNIINHDCYQTSVTWDPDTRTFAGPVFREHANTLEVTVAALISQAEGIEEALANPNSDLTEAERTELTEFAAELRDMPRKYAGIDHWKWDCRESFPTY